ncbi:MAG: DNA-binding protein [Methanosarcinaceae archaeon]|nr:DNA-binding protein [Methanosarcinaceae archaeon]
MGADFPYPPIKGQEHRYIIIDTNGFMVPVQFKVDIFSELNRLGFSYFVVPRAVISELENISGKSSGVDSSAAKFALSLAKKCLVIEISGYADDVIFDEARKRNIAVLTNDFALRERLFSEGLTVISLRQQTHLAKIC